MRRTAVAVLTAGALAALPAIAAAGPGVMPILGGEQTQVGDYPTVVVVEIGQGALCTGTLIHPEWVLTAAHCVDPAVVGVSTQAQVTALIRVRIDSIQAFVGGNQITAATTLKNPGFNVNDLGDDDIGLIKLSERVDDRMLTRVNRVRADAPIGVSVTFVGYGKTSSGSAGRQFDLLDRSSTACAGFGVSDTNLLCFDQQDGRGQCQGDSGGPTFIEVNGIQTVVGVTSFGDQNCAFFGAETRVDAEIAWVEQQIGADALNCVWDGVCADGCTGVNQDPDCPVCANDDECGDDQVCDSGGSCVAEPFTPGGLGTACLSDEECETGPCLTSGEDRLCSADCALDGDDCPSGFECRDAGGTGACWPAPGGGGGGCATSDDHPGGLLVLLAGLGLVVLRPVRLRRRSRRGPP